MEVFLYLGVIFISIYFMVRITDLFFVESIESIARRLNMSPDMAGATLMAFGSSAPEIFVAVMALLRPGGQSQIGLGAIVGSDLFNFLIIIGIVALMKPATIAWQPAVRDLLFYFAAIGLLFLSFRNGEFHLSDAAIFIAFFVVYLFAVRFWRKLFPYSSQYDRHIESFIDDDIEVSQIKRMRLSLFNLPDKLLGLVFFNLNKWPRFYVYNFLLAVFLLGVASFAMVEASIMLAVSINLPEAVIGLTIVAVGTSLPDLISSISATRMGKSDMAIANAISSCIIDIVIGIGVPAILFISATGESFVAVDNENLLSTVGILSGGVIVFLALLISKRWRIGKPTGAILITLYFLYIFWQLAIP